MMTTVTQAEVLVVLVADEVRDEDRDDAEQRQEREDREDVLADEAEAEPRSAMLTPWTPIATSPASLGASDVDEDVAVELLRLARRCAAST